MEHLSWQLRKKVQEKTVKRLTLMPLAFCAFAAPVLAQGNLYSTPSGQPEATFEKASLEQVAGKIANRCMDNGWTIVSQTTNQVVCEFKLNAVASALARVFIGNSYSTDPRAFMRFSMAQIGENVRSQANTWIETQMAFGQTRQEPQTTPDYFDGMVNNLLGAGGLLPNGSQIHGRLMGLSGTIVMNGKKAEYIIDAVAAGQPAEAAGIRKGDRVIKINGKTFENDPQFRARYANVAVGKTFPVTIIRDGTQLELSVLSREWPPVGSEEYKKLMASNPPAQPKGNN